MSAAQLSRPCVAVVGAGPGGLMAAETLAAGGVAVNVYERMPSVGRKFLLAGRGGLNLTHSEPMERLLTRYGDAAPRLRAAIEAFPPDALRDWAAALGQPTFVGSSGRVFPSAFKASPLLRAWLASLRNAGVVLHVRHRWTGWDGAGRLTFATPDGEVTAQVDAVVLALGGASWPRLGSDASWADILGKTGAVVTPLQPTNCGFTVNWSDHFLSRFEGHPLKRIALSFGGQMSRGEAVISHHGLQGGGIYALSALLRDAIAADGSAVLSIALRPDLALADIQQRLERERRKQTLTSVLRKALRLSPVFIGLLREAALTSGESLTAMPLPRIAALVNAVPIRLVATAPLATAISTAGGLSLDEIDEHFMLRRCPGVFVAGEMLDWEAPTGGYLLQASFSTGVAAGRGALRWLQQSRARR